MVDTAAIKNALASGKVACYVTDFPSDELLDVEGVIAIRVWRVCAESEEYCTSMAGSRLIEYLENGNVRKQRQLSGNQYGTFGGRPHRRPA